MRELEVPVKSFLYSDKDYKTDLDICHIGIIGAKFNDMQFWVLGQAFMENFYTVFDGSDPENLRVGLSLDQVVQVRGGRTNWTEIIALTAIGLCAAVFIVIFIVMCHRYRQG